MVRLAAAAVLRLQLVYGLVCNKAIFVSWAWPSSRLVANTTKHSENIDDDDDNIVNKLVAEQSLCVLTSKFSWNTSCGKKDDQGVCVCGQTMFGDNSKWIALDSRHDGESEDEVDDVDEDSEGEGRERCGYNNGGEMIRKLMTTRRVDTPR